MREENLTYFFEPLASSRRDNPYQQNIIDFFHAGKKIVVAPVSNKVGKTAVSSNIIISWCMGYEPWSRVPRGTTDAVEVDGEFFRASSLGKSPPVRIRVTGEDWTHSIGQTIIPELIKWAPKGAYTTRKNSQGVEYLWKWHNGSTIEIMTHDQDVKLFESWLGDGWWPDEPPPYPIWSAMARGLFMTGGKVLMPTTPLKEAWVLDELVLSGRPDVGVIDDVNVWDNPMLYDHDTEELKKTGLSDDNIEAYFKESMKSKQGPTVLKAMLIEIHGEIEGDVIWGDLIPNLYIERFVQDIADEDRMPRLFGQFKSLVGRVVKEYDPDIHDVEPFKIPTDWPVVAGIDFHLEKPHAISYYTINPSSMEYVIDEVFENMSSEDIADDIIRKKHKNGWRLEMAFIDPLSKGDLGFMKNRMTNQGNMENSFTIIRNKLSKHGIILEVGSKDKVSGIDNIRRKFKGPNGLPTLFFFDTCNMHRHQMMRWVFDDKGKPRKVDDDFPENLYRWTNFGIKYTDPIEMNRAPQYMEMGIV